MSVKYNQCLVVSRHKLLQIQKRDIETICEQFVIEPELPTNPQQLKEFIKQYDAVIGVFPIQLQLQILQSGKAVIVFIMESLGVTDTKDEAEKKALQYPDRTAILAPSKEGEKYRMVLYKGMKLIKDIKVVDEWLVQH